MYTVCFDFTESKHSQILSTCIVLMMQDAGCVLKFYPICYNSCVCLDLPKVKRGI